MACSVCGKVQAGRCEGGWITYLSCYTACPKHPDRDTLEPRPRPEWNEEPRPLVLLPAQAADARAAGIGGEGSTWIEDPRLPIPTSDKDDIWTVQPEPSAAGLEDLL